MPDDPRVQRLLGGTHPCMGALKTCEHALGLSCAGCRRPNPLPPALDARGGFTIEHEIVLTKLPPRGIEGERGFLRRVEPLSQRGDLLPKFRAPSRRRSLGVPRNALEPLKHGAQLVMPELERRCGEEEHSLENAAQRAARDFLRIRSGIR